MSRALNRALSWGTVAMVAALALSYGCKSNRQAHVEGVWVAQADGLSAATKGPVQAIVRKVPMETMPEGDIVRLAISRDVEWSQVRELRKQIMDAGKTPELVVASGRKVGGFVLDETLESEDVISVFVSVGGKLCVAPPNSREAKCVERGDQQHVDRAFTRELVREAVKVYHLDNVLVRVPPDLEWADVVRAVDGARTCCYEKKVRVRLKK